jgi:hypothetical protein
MPPKLSWPSPTLRSSLLYQVQIEIDSRIVVGQTPEGLRSITPVGGGLFEGPRLRGRVRPGGADWPRINAVGHGTIRHAV